MKKLIATASWLLLFSLSMHGQLLKKLKDKVGNAVEKKATPAAVATPDATGNTTTTNASSSSKKETSEWCKLMPQDGTYQKIYSGATGSSMHILYDESCLGLGSDGKGFTMVITETTNGKTEYVVINNGTETGRYSQMKDEYLPCRKSSQFSTTTANRFVIADSTKVSTTGSKAETIKTKSIDEKKMQEGMDMAKQTDEYKNLSADEKKQVDAMMKNMPGAVGDYNKTMADKTYTVGSTPATSGSYVSGYRIVVNKKEYGKFLAVYKLIVSPDEKNVYAIVADKAGTVFLANDKKVNLSQKGCNGGGELLMNNNGTAAVYMEMIPKTSAELEKDANDYDNAVNNYRVIRTDGKVLTVSVTGGYRNVAFKLANNGALIAVNPKTGEITADGKPAGKFNVAKDEADALNAQTIFVGETLQNICYYSSDGSLNFPDGTKKQLGIFYPSITTVNGVTFISWFRQCGKEIYTSSMKF